MLPERERPKLDRALEENVRRTLVCRA